MASADRESIMGVWGQSPSGVVQGQSPWSAGQRAELPEAESLLQFSSAQLMTWKLGHFSEISVWFVKSLSTQKRS